MDALADLLAQDGAALLKAAGVAAVRRAASTPAGPLEWRQQGAVLVLDLPALGQSCRWVAGAGFAGMVSEVPARERKAVHLMALAALLAEHGKPLPWPEGMAGPSQAVAASAQALRPGERVFIDQVQATLHELLTGGLAHVSSLTSARLLALNMSARSEGLPRLAALLRNLGGMVQLLVQRDHRAREADALALLSQLQALCDALRHGAEHSNGSGNGDDKSAGDLLAALRGRVQRDFDATAELELLPLGAHWWQTAGGARGLSLALWDVQAQRLLQAVLARPDGSDTGFSRYSAWSTQSLWPGSGPAEQVCRHALQLAQPRLSDDGRLAVGGVTRAQSLPLWAVNDPRLHTLGINDWQLLTEGLRRATGLAAEPMDMALLRPSDMRAPQLHEARQCLAWLVQDAHGRWLELSLPVTPDHQLRLENLQRFAARKAPVVGVLVRVERDSSQCLLVPVAVLSHGPKADGNVLQVVSLDFVHERKQASPLGQRILKMLELRQQARLPPATGAPGLAQRLLAPVLELLETQAATGRMALTAHQVDAFQAALPPVASVGWRSVAKAMQSHLDQPGPLSLLRLHRLCQWLQQLEGLPMGSEDGR